MGSKPSADEMLEKKEDKTHDEEEFLKGIKEPTDLVDVKHIKSIVEFVEKKELA